MRGAPRRQGAKAPSEAPSLLIADFDSVEQRDFFACSANDPTTLSTTITRLTGLLRTALLLSEVVCLTDMMIFDGAYFARIGLHDLGRELGMSSWRLPLVVLSRPHDGSVDFRAALESRLDNPNFIWQLEGLGYSRDEIRAHGERWLQAHADGLFEVRPWNGEKTPPLCPGGFLSRESARSVPESIETEQGRVIADEMLSVTTRSALLSALERRRENASSELLADLQRIEEWWLDAYLR